MAASVEISFYPLFFLMIEANTVMMVFEIVIDFTEIRPPFRVGPA
jgi:hypothetical protein